MLVRKLDGAWQEWRGHNDAFTVTVDVVRIVKDDDANTEIEVSVADVGMEPYTKTVVLSAAGVEAALRSGTWVTADLARFDLAIPTLHVVSDPDAMRIAGSPTYEERPDGSVQQVYAEEPIPPPPPPNADFSITPLQARRALRQAGIKNEVEAHVATLSEEDQEAWEYATEIRRDSKILNDGAKALGWTTKQLDDLFVLAATL